MVILPAAPEVGNLKGRRNEGRVAFSLTLFLSFSLSVTLASLCLPGTRPWAGMGRLRVCQTLTLPLGECGLQMCFRLWEAWVF